LPQKAEEEKKELKAGSVIRLPPRLVDIINSQKNIKNAESHSRFGFNGIKRIFFFVANKLERLTPVSFLALFNMYW
jgi:hypothetical protein